MQLSFPTARRPTRWTHHDQHRRALSDTLSSLLPSLSLSAPPLSSSTSLPTTTTLGSSSSPSPSSSPSSASAFSSASPATSLSPSSSAPSSSETSSSAATSTSATDAITQPSSSSTPLPSVTGAGTSSTDAASSLVFYTVATATPSSTATHTSSSGFFSNTAAVAGTFTVVGLASIAAVIAVALFIVRRRHSQSFEDDTEYLDKTPDLSADPSATQVTSFDHGSPSDNGHYGSPMVLSTPPAAYYPDHAYALHPQAFQAEGYPPPGLNRYPSNHTQDYAAQHMYPPDDHNIAYPAAAPRFGSNMPNPHRFTDVELDSAAAPPPQTDLPNALRPSVRPTSTTPTQWANTRFSVDSFYTGIATDTPPGQAF